MAWVAFDRGIRDAEAYGFKCALDRWKKIRAKIHAEVCERGYDAKRNCFVQAYGSKQLDASLLLIPMMAGVLVTSIGSGQLITRLGR